MGAYLQHVKQHLISQSCARSNCVLHSPSTASSLLLQYLQQIWVQHCLQVARGELRREVAVTEFYLRLQLRLLISHLPQLPLQLIFQFLNLPDLPTMKVVRIVIQSLFGRGFVRNRWELVPCQA